MIINNAIYFGYNLDGFDNNNKPQFSKNISYAYDTHMAKIIKFDRIERKKINDYFLKNKDLDSIFINDLLRYQVLLDKSRSIIFAENKIATVWIQANHSCNLACPGCSTGMDLRQDRMKNMPIEVFELCIEKIAKDCIARGVEEIHIRLGGGEPSLRGTNWINSIARIVRTIEKKYLLKIQISRLFNE